MFKKIAGLCAALAVALSLACPSVRAAGTLVLTGPASGKIIEVIDGASIVVQLAKSNDVARVKLIGVEERADNLAFSYLNNTYLGKTVSLQFDPNIPSPQDFYWNVMYVYQGATLINRDLLGKGFAKVNERHRYASMYTNFLEDEGNSQTYQIGVWDDGKALYPYAVGGVNINTASAVQMRGLLSLSDVDNKVIENILEFRASHPFRQVSDLKFVEGVTRELYNRVRNSVTVSTNIQTATERYLITLKNITEQDVAKILNYRAHTKFTDVAELLTKDLISKATYEFNFPFIDVTDRPSIPYSMPDLCANINTATAAQLRAVGIPAHQAGLIAAYRENTDYSYKTLGELLLLPDMNWTEGDLNKYADNLTVLTDVNTARYSELLSLFPDDAPGEADNLLRARPFMSSANAQHVISAASYNRIRNFIYASADTPPKYVNVNTATLDVLKGVGLTPATADAIYRQRGRLYFGRQLPGDYKAFDTHLSLFTNINTATYEELESLSPELSLGMVASIVAYRDDQPFGNLEEVRAFFEKIDFTNLYNSISKYIVVR
jgi:DNA uptake protein ComE-like DNA-binding protein